jgi:glycosyltransferase involved in cell wall biosynthesis
MTTDSASVDSSFWWLSEYPPDQGGIGTFASHVTPALARNGHRPTLLVCQGEPDDITTDGVRLVRAPIRDAFESGNPASIMRSRRRVAELKAEAEAALYHVHITDPTPVLHLATSDVAPAPTVVTLHNELLDKFPTDDEESLMFRLLDQTEIIVCCSASSAVSNTTASPRFAHRIVAVPNGIPISHEQLPLPDTPTIVGIGRLVEQKSFHRAITAMPHVLRSRPDAHLRIIGEGPERHRLEALVDELGLHDAVSLPGHIDHDEMADEFAAAQVVVAPSVHEGLPYALLEAAMFGRPIVGTDIGGISDVVTDGRNGALVTQADADADGSALGAALLDVLDFPEVAAAYADAGRQHVEQRLSLDACVRGYEQVYRAATQRPVDLAVIIPAHNAERHLAATLDSILADLDDPSVQHLTTQIIVIDDGSTDSTAHIAATFADRGVTTFKQPNLRGAMARNAGLALTNSTFVAHFDADDLWEPGRLHALLAPFEADERGELDAVFARAVEFADHDAPAQANVDTEPRSARMPTLGLIRRSTHDRLGGFVPGQHNDQLGWSSLAIANGLRYLEIEAIGMRRRIHATNLSHSFKFTTDTTRVDVIRRALAARRSGRVDDTEQPDV